VSTLKFDVVIAGGGFAGVYCAKSLARALGGDCRSRVALIADQNVMVFQPMLAEVVGSSISPRHAVNPLRLLCRNAAVLRGTIEAIDPAAGRLVLNAGHFTTNVAVEFDHLVLALGGTINLSRVPGMPEHALILKNVGDAIALRGTIIDRFEEANLLDGGDAFTRLLTFVVVGGGFSGVETAGQIVDLLQSIGRLYPRSAGAFRVVLIHSGPHLLPEIGEELGRYAEKKMRERGVEIILNARVTAMTASTVRLQDGRVIESHAVVSTVGNAPHPLIADLCKKCGLESVKGRIVTEPTLRVKNHGRLWAAGDCAAVPMEQGRGATPDAGKDAAFCPPTGQFAMRQGILMGKNIAATILNRESAIRNFTFTGMGELAAIGHRTAVAKIFGRKFSGILAWFMWRTIYLMKLPGLDRKLRVMIDWTLDLFFPRDISHMRSQQTEVVREMHLEKGDQLFRVGEPALSLYIVKSGRVDLLDQNGVVKSAGAGEHFGERALTHDQVWPFDAVAAEPCELVALDANMFSAISRASSSLHHMFEQSARKYLTRERIEALAAAIPEPVKNSRAADVMTKTVSSVRPDMTLAQTLGLIAEHPYSSFPLVDAGGKAIGLVHQHEIFERLQDGSATLATTLENFPAARFATVSPQTSVHDVIERLCRSGEHKLLVVDEQDRLQGVLTPVDLLIGKDSTASA
jgi:NADH:quinone reductase (non-electrogenic)